MGEYGIKLTYDTAVDYLKNLYNKLGKSSGGVPFSHHPEVVEVVDPLAAFITELSENQEVEEYKLRLEEELDRFDNGRSNK
jgi:hypothetical protein